jgi:2-polyprenyl-6-methoxyphenol hydroxylase-like FAD-dependent oxidoreductase
MDRMSHAIVIGGSVAGTLAAAAVAPYADRVTIADRHPIPDGPKPRRGVPQARHAHLLWSGGARAIEELLPGTLEALSTAGARQIGLPSDLVTYSAQGWMRRFPSTQYIVTCSRDLLDWVLREQLQQLHPNVKVEGELEVTGLAGSAERVTGIRTAGPRSEEIEASLVVDASGRASRTPIWLTELGLPPVAEEAVDSGLAYATRIFRAPPGAGPRFPMVNVQANPADGVPGRTATIVPIENEQWLVTLSGTKGGNPPTDEASFVDFALKQMRDPIVGRILQTATPITPLFNSRSGGNRRCLFEKLPSWPAGFLVVGDAVASFNPVYGQGMSVAAQQARKVRDAMARGRPAARRLQAAICVLARVPWQVATGQDIQYPGATGGRPPASAKLVQAYFERLIRTSAANPDLAALLYEAVTFSGPMSRLVSPAAVLAALRGPALPELASAPLTPEELASIGLTHP